MAATAITTKDTKVLKATNLGVAIGFIGAIVYCFIDKKSTGAYIGFTLAGIVVGGTAANLISKSVIK